MKFYKVVMTTAMAGLMLSACGDDSSGYSSSCDVTKASNSAKLEMSQNGETYTHSGTIDGNKILFQFKYVLQSTDEAKELCRDIKNEGFYEDVECSGKSVSFTNTSKESHPTVDRIVEELNAECDDFYGIYDDDDDDDYDDDYDDDDDDDDF